MLGRLGGKQGVVAAALLMVSGATSALLVNVTMGAFSATTSNTGNSFQAAPNFSCAGTRTVVADADTWVSGENKTTNYGSETYIWVRGGMETSRTLVKFPLPNLDACTVTSATLKLYAGSATSTDGSIRTLQAFRLAATWAESTVTWNTQPATTGTAATTNSANGWRLWNVTAHVQAMYQGANNGFLVRDSVETGGGGHRWISRFDSREYVNRPELEITLTQ